MKNRFIHPLVLLFIFTMTILSCVEEYTIPETTAAAYEAEVVIEGRILAGEESVVYLSYTTPLNSEEAVSDILNAQVYVIGQNGYRSQAAEFDIENNCYVVDTRTLENNTHYALEVTVDGDTYQSEFQPLLISPEIDEVTWRENENGVSIHVTTLAEKDEPRHFMWSFEEDWEIHAEVDMRGTDSIKPFYVSNNLLPELIGSHNSFSLFHEAIMLTGLDALLSQFEIDPEYDGTAESTARLASEPNSKAPYPKYNNKRFTVLVEPDELYKSLGYETIDDIIALANKWYTTTKTGAPITDEIRNDYTHRDNPLNQYVAYHIIDRQLKYSSSTSPGGFIMENYVNEGYSSLVNLNQSFDSYEYYETMMPNTMIKVTKPYTNTELRNEIVLNYAQEMGTVARNPEMKNHMNVIVEKFENVITKYPGLANFDQGARNGIIHVIDRILIYNEEEMAGNILNERIRIDVSAIFPELTNNDVRWDLSKSDELVTFIPSGFCEGLVQNNESCEIFYYRPHATYLGSWANYQGDELIVEGLYDFKYRIPHVPAGTYEIRFGYPRGYYRGICQFYFDEKICGIPVDLRWNAATDITIGWTSDKDDSGKQLTDEEKSENDKAMRNRGYMKGPASITLQTGDNGGTMRDSEQSVRKIVGTFRLLKNRDYWLRFKDVTENSDGKNQFDQDYLELVPTSVLNNPLKPEDIY